ncbi:hypothetical protein ACC713_38145, partial [Rhizobium johnstonii]
DLVRKPLTLFGIMLPLLKHGAEKCERFSEEIQLYFSIPIRRNRIIGIRLAFRQRHQFLFVSGNDIEAAGAPFLLGLF